MNVRDEHVSKIAAFLVNQRSSNTSTVQQQQQLLPPLKLSAVKTLMTCLTPPEASWQVQEDVLQGTLEFIITPGMDWEYMDDHSAMALIYELRAKCLFLSRMEQERIRRVSTKGDEAAILISASAKLLEIGIQQSNKTLERHIDSAGKTVKGWVEVEKNPLISDRDAVVAMTFSNAAKRASEYAREGTKVAVVSICDASLTGLQRVGNTLGDQNFADNLSPEGKEVLKAAGKIGIATVGAAAIVGEAIVGTGRSVASKTADVTADVVGHKYGVTAGEVAKNAADTADNVFRAVGNVALVDGTVLAKTVVKNVGKEQIDRDIEKAKEAIQAFEKNASNLMSQTLGIHWEGSFSKQLTNSSSVTEGPDKAQAANDTMTTSSKQEQLVAGSDNKVVTKGTTKCSSAVDRPSDLPRIPIVSKAIAQEDHASDTSSLSSSVSTEVTAYSFARRGKPSQRRGVLLRPDGEPIPSSASSSTSRRKSISARSKRMSHQGLSSKNGARPRMSWA
ncbi:MAG: hypothetical protein SGILL_009196 [Bacillariaceae sp.]